MRAACESYVGGKMLDALTARFATALDGRGTAEPWKLAVDEDPGTLVFTYPPALTAELYGVGAYIRPSIRLEFGGRSEVWPAETHEVQPYCTEVIPDLTTNPSCTIRVLAAERTFWEKATILHTEYHRPHTSGRRERVSRHYADLARLSRGEIGRRALERRELLHAVALHKERYFPAAWAHYAEAPAGALRLVPHEMLERDLRIDYGQMQEMFFEEPESFEVILAQLADLEQRVNRASN
jgi:hypothetical protein